MTRGPNPVADTVARARRALAQGADAVQIANEPNLVVEGWTSANSNDPNLVERHASWFEDVCGSAPEVPILWSPPSPGVPGYEIWINHPRARQAMGRSSGISWHTYGDLTLMRNTLDLVIPVADELGLDVYVTECNFGAGNQVNLNDWAAHHLSPFLDHARGLPQVKLVVVFAHVWPHAEGPIQTSLNLGGTIVEQTLGQWIATARPPRPSDRRFFEREGEPPIDEPSGPTPAEMAAANPNIRQQTADWQLARAQNGQDPNDWLAFRAHLIGIGAPDPGPAPFAGFLRTTLVQLQAANPNIRQQRAEWQAARVQS